MSDRFIARELPLDFGKKKLKPKPFDAEVLGSEIDFSTPEGTKHGVLLDGEFAEHAPVRNFLGYTAWCHDEQVNYVRVKQFEDGHWEMVPARLT